MVLDEGHQVSGQIAGANPSEPETIMTGAPIAVNIIAKDEDEVKKYYWLGFGAQS